MTFITYCIQYTSLDNYLTCFVIVRTFPFDLCFCFFFTVFTVRFLPCFQLIAQPNTYMYNGIYVQIVEFLYRIYLYKCLNYFRTLPLQRYISGPSKLNGSPSGGAHFISYSLVSSLFVKYSFGSK